MSEYTPVINAHRETLYAQNIESFSRCGYQLALRKSAFFSDNIDVALHKLPEPSLLRSVCPPNITCLHGFEYDGKRTGIIGIVASKGQSKIITQPEIAEFAVLTFFEFFSSFQYTENKLFIFTAVFAFKQTYVLHTRRFYTYEAVASVHFFNGVKDFFSFFAFFRKEISHPFSGELSEQIIFHRFLPYNNRRAFRQAQKASPTVLFIIDGSMPLKYISDHKAFFG